MYIHIGGHEAVFVKDILAILDLENTASGSVTQEFMKKAEKEKKVINAARDLPRAMIITDKNILISGISASLLQKRANAIASRKLRER